MWHPEACESFPYSPNYSYYFDFEKTFDVRKVQVELSRLWYAPYLACLVYLVGLYAGQEVMKRRSPFNLRRLLILWNVALCVFSVIGAIRVLPEMSHVIKEYGLTFSVCDPSGFIHNRVFATWNCFFTMSKFFELLDTLFLVLTKRPVIFLHYFHHAATLVVSYHGFTELIAISRWFVNMNYLVHSVMYAYYALKAAGVKIPRWIAMPITVSQILQMILGTLVSFYAWAVLWSGQQCAISFPLCTAFVALYSYYFYLFSKFFVASYCGRKRPKQQ